MEIAANLEKLIIEVSGSFKERGIKFCIAGGWAVGIWSTPRATEDRGKKLPIISIEDLILMKKISNRKQDQIDVENLINSDRKIDWDYIKKNADKLDLNFEEIK